MSKLKVLILDDESDRAKRWKLAIEKIVDVDVFVFSTQEVSEVISKLHSARFLSRKNGFTPVSLVDGYDLIIIDYDLLGLDPEAVHAWSTGAEVAYAMRLMCAVGPIVVVNQFGTNSFDLTMRRTISSYADYDIGSVQIVSPGLWQSENFDGFRPWHWPNLSAEVDRFKKMQEFVKGKLDKPVMSVLGFEPLNVEAPNFISHDIAGLLGVRNIQDFTFRELVSDAFSIGVFNILEKDSSLVKTMPDEQLSRVSAAIIWRWLEKVVMPNQQVIVDLPHLIARFPWLLKDYTDPKAWESLSTLDVSDYVIPELSKFRFDLDFFLSRPVFWYEQVKHNFAMPNDFDIKKLPASVFCEDSSSFGPRTESVSYPSDLVSFDSERWVQSELKCLGEDVNYEPQSYLLM
jgi:hypothetical protein